MRSRQWTMVIQMSLLPCVYTLRTSDCKDRLSGARRSMRVWTPVSWRTESESNHSTETEMHDLKCDGSVKPKRSSAVAR